MSVNNPKVALESFGSALIYVETSLNRSKTMSQTPEESVGIESEQPQSGKKWEYVEKTEAQEKELREEVARGSAVDADIEGDAAEFAEMTREELVKALIKANKLAEENWDHFARAKAETQNIIASADKEKQNIRNFALKSFVQALVGVIDNFDRSLENTSSDGSVNAQALVEGIELTRKDFLGMLEKFGVEVVNPLHEKFNPQFHEAVSMQPSSEFEVNTVLTVLQKGYLLNQRLVRPAMVIVSKAK